MIDAIQSASIRSNQPDSPRDKPERILEAAQQFEALLIAKFLEQARETATQGALSDEKDQAGEHAISFAHQQMAGALARSGGFGLARMITAQVSRADSRPEASNASSSPGSRNIEITTKRVVSGAD